VDNRQIIVSPFAFHAPKVACIPHGMTIRQIVERMDQSAWSDAYLVEVDGLPIPLGEWHLVPDVASHILVYAPLHGGGGGGGKNPLRTILTIVVVVVATVVGNVYGGALAAQLGVTSQAGIAAVQAGVSMAAMTAGSLLVNAIAPIKYSNSLAARHSYNDSPTYSIGANSNQANPWGPIPVALGTYKVYPPLGASSYTELVGSDEYLRMLFVWGYGPLKIENIKIGDTLLSSYAGVEIETNGGWSTDTPLTLFPSAVRQDSIGVIITNVGGQIVRTAKANVDELSVDVAFARGLVQFDDQGNRIARSVTVLVQYREVGAPAWTTVEQKTFTDLTTSAVRYGWRWTVDNTKTYEVGITRVTADTSSDQILDELYWVYLRNIETAYPITFPHPLAVTAIRIKATDQLSGQLDNLNGVVSSYCPIWDSVAETWGANEASYAVTNNPAALIRHVLMGKANARARTSTQVDDAGLGEFYEFCATKGYAFNMYRDYTSSVFEACQDIASTARAAITIKDGLWSVTVDTGSQSLVQHITPRNSWGFSAEKQLYNRPHAFRIRFKNELNGYNDDERIVYDDGYNSGNATLFETIEFPGITHPDLIWKFGRYHIAQARLRPEMYSLYMDFEHLVCRKGDKVRVSHDIPLWGLSWGRVKSLDVVSGNIIHITLDELSAMEAGKSYACRFRKSDGTTLVLSIVTEVGETATLQLQTPVAEAFGPKVGDLAMFGEANSETVELLVHSIHRAGDFTAQLFFVDVSSSIYNADTGEIPPFDPQTTTPVDVTTLPPDPPTIEATEAGTDISTTSGGGSTASIIVYLSAPSNVVRIRGYRLRYRIVGETQFQYTPEMDNLTITIPNVIEGVEYEIQAQSISVYGVPSTWTSIGTGIPGTPQIVPAHPTGITAELVAGGEAYNYCAVRVIFTPPPTSLYSHCDIYASNNDLTYHYVGQNTAGSFVFSGLGSIYETGDTCYIKLRSVSTFAMAEAMPAAYDTSIVINGVIRLGGFFAGDDFFGDNEVPANAKILLDKTNSLMRLGATSGDNLILDGDYSDEPAVRSSNYVSGSSGAGFLLKPDLLEVGNIAARGIIRTSVFEYNSISVHSGSDITVKGGDVLAADMTVTDGTAINRITEAGDTRITEAGDTLITEGIAEIIIEGNDTFAVGDILRIKEGIYDEWLEVIENSFAPVYRVRRDKSGNYATDNNPAWTKGASVVNYGQAGDGGIYITASDTNAPNLSVFTHDGEPWDTITTHIREGNLNGYAGYETDVYGWAAYINENNYVKIDPVDGIRMSGSIVITGSSEVPWESVTGTEELTDRIFTDSDTKAIVEAWRKTGSPTYIDGERIFAQTITADKFVSTLYGDMNQAMAYVKTVLGAGDEYEHDVTDTDLSNGAHSTIDADTHIDYGVSIRLATAVKWDDVGAVWDIGTWDEPTVSSGSWTSAAVDLGSVKNLQMAFLFTKIEEVAASTTETIKFIYSSDGTNWGTNETLDDDVWETASALNVTENIYKASGTLKNFRYFKIKIEISTTVTTDRIILHTMTYLGNVINLYAMEVYKAIASGGTTINLSGFKATPAITVTPVGATPLVPVVTAQSKDSATIKLYSLAGADTGGYVNITIIGN